MLNGVHRKGAPKHGEKKETRQAGKKKRKERQEREKVGQPAMVEGWCTKQVGKKKLGKKE